MEKSQKKEKMSEKLYCPKCGRELTDENTHPAHNEYGVSLYCLDCESQTFENFAAQNGLHFGLFLNCARFDVPCEPTLVPRTFIDENKPTKDKWREYVANLLASSKYTDETKTFEFDSGVNRFLRIFGKELSNKDFAAYVLNEQAIVQAKPGTQTQRDKWGEQPLWNDMPCTKEIYDDLDRRYSARVQSYNGQSISPQMEEVLQKACRWDAVIDHLIAKGDAKGAKEVQAMLDSMLASEQMRKKDEKPTEQFRYDAWIVAMEKSGFMQNKDFVGPEAMMNAMCAAMRRQGKYKQPLDVAHQFELNVYNAARKNADQPPIYSLPAWLEITDEYGEFEKVTSDEYRAALKYCGLTEVKIDKVEKTAKTAEQEEENLQKTPETAEKASTKTVKPKKGSKKGGK